jgi:putative glutamine amidotransferase
MKSKMTVHCATKYCADSYTPFFEKVVVITDPFNVPDDVKLLILSGGGDVCPALYGHKNTHSYGIDTDRDTAETQIVKAVLSKNIGAKILGICRGAQLLNVFYGGDLHQDIGIIGRDHKPMHELKHTRRNPLAWLTYSNSLHHQAIDMLGYGGQLIAVEPETGIPEIVYWPETSLAVQFHPEMFSLELGSKFFSTVEDWVNGKCDFRDQEEKLKHDWDMVNTTTKFTYEFPKFKPATVEPVETNPEE